MVEILDKIKVKCFKYIEQYNVVQIKIKTKNIENIKIYKFM